MGCKHPIFQLLPRNAFFSLVTLFAANLAPPIFGGAIRSSFQGRVTNKAPAKNEQFKLQKTRNQII